MQNFKAGDPCPFCGDPLFVANEGQHSIALKCNGCTFGIRLPKRAVQLQIVPAPTDGKLPKCPDCGGSGIFQHEKNDVLIYKCYSCQKGFAVQPHKPNNVQIKIQAQLKPPKLEPEEAAPARSVFFVPLV